MTNSNFDFGARITRLGIYTTFAALIANFIPVGYLALGLGVSPSVQDLIRIWLVAAAAFGVGWVIQVVSFFPVHGSAGSLYWLGRRQCCRHPHAGGGNGA